MQEPNLFLIFVNKFNALDINYVITGSIAAVIYGEPRVTHDIDLVVELKSDEDIKSIVKAFPAQDFYCAPFEVIKVEKSRNQRGHFNVIHHETGFKADVYLLGKDKLNLWAFENHEEIDFLKTKINVAPLEYVIVRKLEYYKEGKSQKHLNDIHGMLSNSSSKLNIKILKKFIDEFDLQKEWKKINFDLT